MSSPKERKSSPEGHRQRCKKHLLSKDREKLTDVELLEMLLFYAVLRADTRPIAERLLAEYGTLERIIFADPEEISAIPGLKEGANVLFALLRETVMRASVREGDKNLLHGGKLKEYLIELFKGKDTETVYALYFGNDGGYLGKQVIFRGGISSARFSLRTITEGTIRIGGKAVILAHNHPSDSLIPSGDDVLSTKRIAAHLAANEIELIEHYIVGKSEAVGILNPNG